MSDPAPWERLDARMTLVHLKYVLGPAVPVLLGWVLVDPELSRDVVLPLVILIAAAVAATGYGLVQWATTRFRLGEFDLQVRSGLVLRRHRSIARDRIRSVDLSAPLVHRMFGVSVLRVGTGQSVAGTDLRPLVFDGLARGRADELRRDLLRHSDSGPLPVAVVRAETELSTLRWSWVRFAPLSLAAVSAVWLALVAVYRILDIVDVGVAASPVGSWVTRHLDTLGNATAVAALAGVVALVGGAGSVLVFVESWWWFRLTCEGDGTVRVRRGLLTTRSMSLPQHRVRGVQLRRALPLRWVGAANTQLIATGLSTAAGSGLRPVGAATVLPPAPLAHVHAVSATLLAEPVCPLQDAVWRAHPRAALIRRLVRAAVVTATAGMMAVGIPALADGRPGWGIGAAVVAGTAGASVALAVDAWRGLGHGLQGRYLLMRSGTWDRTSVALRRDGVIGWRIRSSPGQRRVGLCTLTATTAAGRGHYSVRDLPTVQAVSLADAAVPGLLAPFLLEADTHQT